MADTTNRVRGELVADLTKILGRAMYLGAQDAEQGAPDMTLEELRQTLAGGKVWSWWSWEAVTRAYLTGRKLQDSGTI